MKKVKASKQAVVIIHGIGNQFPMDTAREFVENITNQNDILYSSPDREANFFETRRLSLSRKKTDFYEFYWANLVSEPSNSDLFPWIIKLLFRKKPSPRAKILLYKVRITVIVLLLLLAFFILKDIKHYTNGYGFTIWNTGIFSIVSFILLRFILPSINLTLSRTAGDVLKYLTPSPQNIDSRYKIKQKGINLLKKLHEKKDKYGNPLYKRIVIVGHSLGSVVGYDLITNLWHDYIYSYAPEKAPVLQPILDEMSTLISDYHKKTKTSATPPQFPLQQYTLLQEQLYAEIKSLNNPWLISDFISIGSPLCHGAYIMANDYAEFDRKTNYRELPLSPPKIEVKLSGNQIVKDYANAISYHETVKGKDGNEIAMRIINHSSQFAFIKWNNIYFENDYVGGELNYYFGEGIQNHRFIPKGSNSLKKLPFYSHIHYWDTNQDETLELLRNLLFKS